ncbi:MAG: glycosyltransferase family 2 protein [Gammaproteobacteria bacterium]|jgi:glycosyltransferase involved in cell wall biosynthesis|nr:glycosyltransferase [Gammaproteobacteria bacterium]
MADTLPRLSVVIPLYKEEDNVERLVDELHAALETYPGEFELVLVDDGSTDRTREMLLDARANRGDHIMVISHRRNLGQTQAMQTGLQAARGDVIAFMDGDLQNDPADIPAMVEKLETDHLDLLCGWRKNRQDTLDRTLPSRMANWLIGRVSGVALHDYGCSLKVGRRDVLEGLDLRGEMHRFIPLWVANLTHPSRIAEIAVNHRARIAGTSKYGISRTPRVILDLLAAWFFLRFRERPGHFFGVAGLITGGLGGIALTYLFVLKLFGMDIGNRPLLITGVLLALVGLQLITTGLVAEMLTRLRSRSQPPLTKQTDAMGWTQGSNDRAE